MTRRPTSARRRSARIAGLTTFLLVLVVGLPFWLVADRAYADRFGLTASELLAVLGIALVTGLSTWWHRRYR